MSAGNELVLCGSAEVCILDLDRLDQGRPREVWSCALKDRPELSAEHRELLSWFGSTDECKPVAGGERILVTSVAGLAALVERHSGRATLCGWAPGAHSAELLPEGRVAVAASHPPARAPEGAGNRLAVYDPGAPGEECCGDELLGAHGLVWDEPRGVLWALGKLELRSYRLAGWTSSRPALARAQGCDLPEPGGHDLRPVPGSDALALSTSHHVWLFDRERLRFDPHPDLADAAGVKGLSVHPVTGRIAWVQREEGLGEYSDRIRFCRPEGVLHLPGRKFYKVRWNAKARWNAAAG